MLKTQVCISVNFLSLSILNMNDLAACCWGSTVCTESSQFHGKRHGWPRSGELSWWIKTASS